VIGVLNYGVGNVGSFLNMFKKIGIDSQPVTTPSEVSSVSRLILPGVGSYDFAMRSLADKDLVEPLKRFAASGRPLLGICLGMQLLVDSSEEGALPGLGLIQGSCRRIERSPSAPALRTPHMGWNPIRAERKNSILADVPSENRFYFVHSYFVQPTRPSDVLATTEYGTAFASMIAKENIVGAQFHPEKSHHFGMKLLHGWATT
jgi:glutamine amidotransferase